VEISQTGLDLIMQSEGFSATPYDDNGKQAWGYGHDALAGEEVPTSITEPDAQILLKQDLSMVMNAVQKLAPQANQNQFDALCDFAYNLGVGALQTMLSHGFDQVPSQIPRWNHVNRVESAGLTQRRAAEVALFNTPED
jgi:lysozyme